MVPMLFVRWCAICSRFHTLYVSMQRRLWPIAQLGVPLSKLVLSKLVKFLIPAALVNHGCCWKYADQRHDNVYRLKKGARHFCSYLFVYIDNTCKKCLLILLL